MRDKDNDKQASGGVQSVDRALGILRCFSGHDGALSLTDIAERTGYYKSTVLRLAASLEQSGFLIRRADKLFGLGPELMRLGMLYSRTFRLEEHIRPALRQLVQSVGESTSFFRREGDKRICLYREEGAHTIREHALEGDLLPVYSGAAGRIFSLYDPTHPSPETGITLPIVSIGGLVPDMAALAVPIFSSTGLAGALTVSGPLTRFTQDRIAAMREPLCAIAKSLCHTLGGDTAWNKAIQNQ